MCIFIFPIRKVIYFVCLLFDRQLAIAIAHENVMLLVCVCAAIQESAASKDPSQYIMHYYPKILATIEAPIKLLLLYACKYSRKRTSIYTESVCVIVVVIVDDAVVVVFVGAVADVATVIRCAKASTCSLEYGNYAKPNEH